MSNRNLLSPFSFPGGARAKNRVALAAMTNGQSHADGSLGDDELRWLTRRAEGGFGVVTTCAAHVTPDGQGWAGELGIFDDALLPGLGRLAAAVRRPGALALVQIFHGGARADRALTGVRPWSASEIPGDPAEPRAGTVADIERVIAAFRDAAVRAHRAGFDGVELHGAHGYLLGQFLSRLNVRADGWGGPAFADRARLLREVTRAVRAAVPAPFVVGVRISPEDWGNAKGLDLDESLTLAGWLAEDGIDFLHLSLWTAANNTTKRPDQHPLPLFRRACPDRAPLRRRQGVDARRGRRPAGAGRATSSRSAAPRSPTPSGRAASPTAPGSRSGPPSPPPPSTTPRSATRSSATCAGGRGSSPSIPWIKRASALAPDGTEIALWQRGDEHVVRADGADLMSTRTHGSEESARRARRRRPRPRRGRPRRRPGPGVHLARRARRPPRPRQRPRRRALPRHRRMGPRPPRRRRPPRQSARHRRRARLRRRAPRERGAPRRRPPRRGQRAVGAHPGLQPVALRGARGWPPRRGQSVQRRPPRGVVGGTGRGVRGAPRPRRVCRANRGGARAPGRQGGAGRGARHVLFVGVRGG